MTKKRYISDEDRLMMDTTVKWTSSAIINNKPKKCADLIQSKYKDREEQFSKAFKDHKIFWPQYMAENTLDFSYVEPGTFTDQKDGYWRLQLSWGGPSDEIRYYKADNSEAMIYDQITYSYMDWFDGAEIQVHADIWHKIFSDYFETDAISEGQI